MLEELVERYIDALDAGEDDIALYEQIRRLSKEQSQMASLEVAEVARILYYRKKAYAHRPDLLARLNALLESIHESDATRGRTLGEYFNDLITRLHLNWPHILREMGISPNQSHNFSKAFLPLTTLLNPDKIAWLAKRLQADASTVLRLARQDLQMQLPHATASGSVSYRILRGYKASSDISPGTESDEERMLAYLENLERQLRA